MGWWWTIPRYHQYRKRMNAPMELDLKRPLLKPHNLPLFLVHSTIPMAQPLISASVKDACGLAYWSILDIHHHSSILMVSSFLLLFPPNILHKHIILSRDKKQDDEKYFYISQTCSGTIMWITRYFLNLQKQNLIQNYKQFLNYLLIQLL